MDDLECLCCMHDVTFLQYEILHTFTLATLNAMCQELESCECDNDVIRDPIEMFHVLDETHQQYRSRLLKAIKKIR
jgi:hypothetical protein